MKLIRTQPTLSLTLPTRNEHTLIRGSFGPGSDDMPSQDSFLQRVASDELLYPESPQHLKHTNDDEPQSSQTTTRTRSRITHFSFKTKMADLFPN